MLPVGEIAENVRPVDEIAENLLPVGEITAQVANIKDAPASAPEMLLLGCTVAGLLEAIGKGITYKYDTSLRSMSITQAKSGKITAHLRKNKPATLTVNFRTVLPTKILDSCSNQIAIFQIRWSSDHGKPIPQHDLTLMTGKWVFGIPTLKAMRSWYIVISHFDGMDAALRR